MAILQCFVFIKMLDVNVKTILGDINVQELPIKLYVMLAVNDEQTLEYKN